MKACSCAHTHTHTHTLTHTRVQSTVIKAHSEAFMPSLARTLFTHADSVSLASLVAAMPDSEKVHCSYTVAL